jgi:omega-6 fatty acid desaturase (delta-12 desaturase)
VSEETTLEREEREERVGSLKPVLDVIPDAAYENPTWKGMSYFARDLVIYLGTVTALIFVANPFADVALDVLAILAVTALFVVAHDSAHGALFNTKRKNSIIGRIAMLPSWHVFEAWVLGHNRIHHAFTVRQGYDFVWHPVTAQEYADKSRAGKLLHHIEWSWWGAGLYYLKEVWWHKMIAFTPPARWVKAIRRDRIVTLGFVLLMAVGLGVLAYARTHSIGGVAWLILRVEVVPFLGFSAMIGSVVHVHHVAPDIRWWKRNEWNKFKGQMEGTTVLRVPKGVNFFFHWIMIHSPHHVDMRIPMYNLEMAALAIEKMYPDVVHDAPLRFKDFRHNTKVCKLYDFDEGHWLTYRAAREFLATATPPTLVAP